MSVMGFEFLKAMSSLSPSVSRHCVARSRRCRRFERTNFVTVVKSLPCLNVARRALFRGTNFQDVFFVVTYLVGLNVNLLQ